MKVSTKKHFLKQETRLEYDWRNQLQELRDLLTSDKPTLKKIAEDTGWSIESVEAWVAAIDFYINKTPTDNDQLKTLAAERDKYKQAFEILVGLIRKGDVVFAKKDVVFSHDELWDFLMSETKPKKG